MESEPESEPDGAAGAAGLGVTVTAAGPPARLRRVDIVTDSEAAGRARGVGPDSPAGRRATSMPPAARRPALPTRRTRRSRPAAAAGAANSLAELPGRVELELDTP